MSMDRGLITHVTYFQFPNSGLFNFPNDIRDPIQGSILSKMIMQQRERTDTHFWLTVTNELGVCLESVTTFAGVRTGARARTGAGARARAEDRDKAKVRAKEMIRARADMRPKK